MSRRSPRKIQTQAWQWDPSTLTLDQIQYWSPSGTLVGLMPLTEARALVASLAAFCGGPNYIIGMHPGVAMP